MEGSRGNRQRNLVLAAVFTSILGSWTPGVLDPLPRDAKDALSIAGKRLSRTLSAGDLTTLATHGDLVLASLTRPEREALAQGYLRFKIDSPADLLIASPKNSNPFWLVDLGFKPVGTTLSDDRMEWDLHRKTYKAGWVNLGVNGLDRTPPAHYAVFIRGLEGKAVAVEMTEKNGWEVVEAVSGISLERHGGRTLEALPAFLTNARLIRTEHDRRHQSMLARGRVWKTHEVASTEPDQVLVSFGNDAPGSLNFSWRTSAEVVNSPLRLRRAGGSSERNILGDFEAIEVPELLNDPVVLRHTAHVEGLDPGTLYEYAIGTKETKWRSIQTPPRVSGDLCLLYMGDPQCGLEGWGKLLAKAVRSRPDAAAILIAGDLVDRGNERTNWDHFFLRAKGVFEHIPVMPAVGNHEYLDRGPWLYRSHFSLPQNGPAGMDSDLVYSFEVGDAFVAVLDSTAAVSDANLAKIQADWLDDRLSKTRKTWKLVMFHHPLYASHPSRESPALRAAWTPIFDRHHVDLILQGHDHAYLRTYPLRESRRVDSPALGTVYVVSVSGDKYYEQRAAETTEVGFTHVSTYQTIDLKPKENRLIYRCFDANGRERDAFSIEKPAGKPLSREAIHRPSTKGRQHSPPCKGSEFKVLMRQ